MYYKRLKLYENRPEITLTAYIPADSPEMLAGRPRPAIIICPGGGYVFCSDREAEPVALRFLAMGYAAFVLRYSTYAGSGSLQGMPTANSPVRDESVYPAALRDLGKAVLTVRERAEEWGVDREKIVLCGFSAGAHNCALYAANFDKPVLTEHLGCTAQALRPAAALLCYGMYDYAVMQSHRPSPMVTALNIACNLSLLGTATPSAEQLAQVCPLHMVSEKMPPCFLWATAGDVMVPARQSLNMAAALHEAGVPVEAHVFETGPHGLALSEPASSGSIYDLDAAAAQWVPLAQTWLERRFALPLSHEPSQFE